MWRNAVLNDGRLNSMITIMKQEDSSYKITVAPNEDNKYIGYTYKPFYKYLGICPHRFVRGIGNTTINEEGLEIPGIIVLKGEKLSWNGMQPVKVQKIFKINEGFEITLDEGYRAGKHLSKILYS